MMIMIDELSHYMYLTCTNKRFPIAKLSCPCTATTADQHGTALISAPIKPWPVMTFLTTRDDQNLSWTPTRFVVQTTEHFTTLLQLFTEVCVAGKILFFLILTKMFRNYPRLRDVCSINDTFFVAPRHLIIFAVLKHAPVPEVWLAQQAMKWSRTSHGMALILASARGEGMVIYYRCFFSHWLADGRWYTKQAHLFLPKGHRWKW